MASPISTGIECTTFQPFVLRSLRRNQSSHEGNVTRTEHANVVLEEKLALLFDVMCLSSSSDSSQYSARSSNLEAHNQQTTHLVHLFDQCVDRLLAIAKVATLHVMPELPCPEAAGRVAKLEWPEEVVYLLEVRADGVDLVDQVLHAHNAVLAQMLLNDRIVGERDALLLRGLGISTLVDELADGLKVRVAVGDEGLDDLQHLHCGLGQANEDAIVDLEETEELEGLALLWVDLVDTLDADDKGEFWFGRHEVGAFLLGDTGEADLLALCVAVLFHIRLGTLEDLLTLLLVLLCMLLAKLSWSASNVLWCRRRCSVPKDG